MLFTPRLTSCLAALCLFVSFLPSDCRAGGFGDLVPVLCPDDQSPPVPDGNTTRNWKELKKELGNDTDVSDLFGQSVAISGKYAIVGASEQSTGGVQSGAAYIYRLDASGWVQEAKLLPNDPGGKMNFGYYVDIQGEYAIIGAHQAIIAGTEKGAAYIFKRSGTTWTQQNKLVASDGATSDRFGHGVRLDGNLAVIGAYGVGDDRGKAYVFSRSGTTWTEDQILLASDGRNGDRFGFSVGIHGGTIVVGADQVGTAGISNGGLGYVFVVVNGTWTEQAILKADDAQGKDRMGFTIDIFGDYVVAGARQHDSGGDDAGAAYVFYRTGTSWAQQAKLESLDLEAKDNFGINVSIHEDLIAVGAFNESTKGGRAGAAYVFARSGNDWTEQSKILASDGAAQDLFGRSISISNGRVIVGSNHNGSAGADAGAVYFFGPAYELDPLEYPNCTASTTVSAPTATDNCDGTVTGSTADPVTFSAVGTYSIAWNFTDAKGNKVTATQSVTITDQLGSPVPVDAVSFDWQEAAKVLSGDPGRQQFFGAAVAIDGVYAVVGMANEKAGVGGAAYVFKYTADTWTRVAKLGSTGAGVVESFGNSVSISGNRIAVGASGAGAVYVFDRIGSNWFPVKKVVSPASPTDDYFGFDVALSGNRLLVGATEEVLPGTNTGAAYIFERGNGNFSAFTKLVASDGESDDLFGYSVAIDGNFLIVGAEDEDTDGSDSGAAYIFEFDGSSWNEATRLKAEVAEAGATFGHDVAISGTRVVVGADSDGKFFDNAGAAYVYERRNGIWGYEVRLSPGDAVINDFFGSGVDISGDRILVGADRVGQNPLEAGAAYLFEYVSGSWQEVEKLLPSDTQAYANFGRMVALSGDRLLVGAPRENDGFEKAGAAYFFTRRAVLPRLLLSNCKPSVTTPPTALDGCGASVPGVTDGPTSFSEVGTYSILWSFTDTQGNTSVATQEVKYIKVTVSIPYFELFSEGSPRRDCWETVDVAGDGGWRLSDDPAQTASGAAGAYYLPPATGSGQDDRLLSPPLNYAAGTDYRLTFAHRAVGTATEKLRVFLVDVATGNEVKQLFEDDAIADDYTTSILVISVPANGSYRIVFESTSAVGSRGILIDNFTFAPELDPNDGAATLRVATDDICYFSTAPGLNGDAWTNFYDADLKRFVEINANGNDLGDVAVEMTDYQSPPLADFVGRMMSRYFNITPQNGSGPYTNNGGVKIRMYFTDAELIEYRAAVDRNGNWSDLEVTHYSTPDDDCSVLNNDGDEFEFIPQSLNKAYGNNAHYIEFVTTSFSEFGAAGSSAFPVVLTEFTAIVDGPGNLLEWEVQSEVDFSHYRVERSRDGIEFYALARVDGTNSARYSQMDLAPASVQYYRLKMIDADGTFRYSKVISLSRNTDESTLALEAFPVPATHRVMLRFSAAATDIFRLTVSDPLGRVVQSRQYAAHAGVNEIPVELADLSVGTYQVTLQGDTEVHSKRIVKR